MADSFGPTREDLFENSVIKCILRHVGRRDLFDELRVRSFEQFDDATVRLSAFRDAFPNFPYFLETTVSPEIGRTALWEMMRYGSGTDNVFVRKYGEVATMHSLDLADYSFGLVFRSGPTGKFVMHNGYRCQSRPDRSPRFVFPVVGCRPPLSLTIEPLAGLLSTIESDWLPAEGETLF